MIAVKVAPRGSELHLIYSQGPYGERDLTGRKAGNNSHMRELYSNFTATTRLDYISAYSRGGIKLYQLESTDAIEVE